MSIDINSINPYIRRIMASVLPKGTKINRRIIFDYELIYIEQGEFILNYNDCEYTCQSGQFVLLRPKVPHSFTCTNTDLIQPHIHFDMIYSPFSEITPISFKDFPDLSEEEKRLVSKDILSEYPIYPFINFTDKVNALRVFYSIVNDQKASPLSSKAHLVELIDMMIADNSPKSLSSNSPRYSIANQIKDYIDAEQGLCAGLDDLAKTFSYSKYYLERIFKKEYGISLITYRNCKRMEFAAKLLKNNSVSNVTEKLGFSSIYAFSRAFKEHFGFSPTKYKKQINN